MVYRGKWIKIEDVTYLASEINKIPVEYKPDQQGGKPDKPVKVDRIDAAGAEASGDDPDAQGYIYGPNVNMKLTKAGLTFSGPTAFVSNLSLCDFVFKGQPYSSSEQGLQHLNAVHNNAPEIARKILKTTCAKTIKTMSHDIPKSDTWRKLSPGVLLELNEAKYDQNPPLLKKLVETAPHKLVEASIDSFWGGGAHFGADVYEQGIVPGKNTFGDMATNLRDKKIAEIALDSSLV